jgi:hypothetical protein
VIFPVILFHDLSDKESGRRGEEVSGRRGDSETKKQGNKERNIQNPISNFQWLTSLLIYPLQEGVGRLLVSIIPIFHHFYPEPVYL